MAAEAGVEPAFVEKDWFAVQLLAMVAEHNKASPVKGVFSGGTSLSKGHGLIKRFSEDLDFFLSVPGGAEPSVGQRRNYRHGLLGLVTSQDGLFQIDGEVKRGDSHRFFKAPILYPIGFKGPALRPHLQLEMTFIEPRIPAEMRPIRSMIAQVANEPPETEILCISPLETAADKLSALSWRVVVRDRTHATDDPTLIRHLHDLAVLEPLITENPAAFLPVAAISMDRDRAHRGGEIIAGLPNPERLKQALHLLRQDAQYKAEYEQFVMAMSYADEGEKIHFEHACDALERIIALYPEE